MIPDTGDVDVGREDCPTEADLPDCSWQRDVGPKRDLYVREEIPVYWIVDADDRVVTVVRPGHDDVRVADVLTWHPDGAPVALEIPLAEIFE